MDVEWAIIGGGIHGVHIAASLQNEYNLSTDDIRIVDPAEQLLARWRTCTHTTGMRHLRSPSVHHLDVDPLSLQRFAGKKRNRKPGVFSAPYMRPSLELFNAHCDYVIEKYALKSTHLAERAEAIHLSEASVRIQTTKNDFSARRIVFAIGASEQPQWPQWAPKENPRIQHIFENDFSLNIPSKNRIAIVGAGISGAQIALRLNDEEHEVCLFSRHPLREHLFDSDPGWLGPKLMNRFSREPSPDKRRSMITQARNRGSIPPNIRHRLRDAIHKSQISFHQNSIVSVHSTHDGIALVLDDQKRVEVDRILLATGFESTRPGGDMIDRLVRSASLPCAKCGFPLVDRHLRWHPKIFVSGPLAELEVGPTSRNIAGARRAAERIIASSS